MRGTCAASRARVRELEATLADALWRADRAEQEMVLAQTAAENSSALVERTKQTVLVRGMLCAASPSSISRTCLP